MYRQAFPGVLECRTLTRTQSFSVYSINIYSSSSNVNYLLVLLIFIYLFIYYFILFFIVHCYKTCTWFDLSTNKICNTWTKHIYTKDELSSWPCTYHLWISWGLLLAVHLSCNHSSCSCLPACPLSLQHYATEGFPPQTWAKQLWKRLCASARWLQQQHRQNPMTRTDIWYYDPMT